MRKALWIAPCLFTIACAFLGGMYYQRSIDQKEMLKAESERYLSQLLVAAARKCMLLSMLDANDIAGSKEIINKTLELDTKAALDFMRVVSRHQPDVELKAQEKDILAVQRCAQSRGLAGAESNARDMLSLIDHRSH